MTGRIVIIGNGAIGMTAASELATRATGAEIVIIGPRNRTGGASAAAGAMLGCFGELTKYSLATDAGRRKFALGLDAHAMWPAHLDHLGEVGGTEPIKTVSDTFVVLNAVGGELDSENFDAMLAGLDEHHGRYEIVDSVPGLDPTPTARPLRSLWLPDEGSIDASQLLASLEASCSRLGVRAVDAEVLELQSTPSWCATTTNGERIEADVFIVATGAWSADLVRTITEDVQPMVSGSGVALVTERVMGDGFNSVVRTANRAGSCGLHVVPLSQGFEYYGATNVIFERPETRAHLGVINYLTDCVINQLDRLAAYSRIDKVVVGNRPVTLDTYPLLGRVEDTPVFMATGTYRDGLHSSPAIAAALRAEILDDEAAFDPVFAPTRRPILEFTRAEAIAEFTHQQVSSAFESGLSLTPFLHAQDLQAVFAPMAESLHDRLPDVVGLHPDLVAFACLSRKDPESVGRIVRHLKGCFT